MTWHALALGLPRSGVSTPLVPAVTVQAGWAASPGQPDPLPGYRSRRRTGRRPAELLWVPVLSAATAFYTWGALSE